LRRVITFTELPVHNDAFRRVVNFVLHLRVVQCFFQCLEHTKRIGCRFFHASGFIFAIDQHQFRNGRRVARFTQPVGGFYALCWREIFGLPQHCPALFNLFFKRSLSPFLFIKR
jgi:hypothetical protein